jgi:AraC-like DNA-binding protein
MLLVNPDRTVTHDEHTLLWGRGQHYYVPSFAGPLSVKSVLSGDASWATDESRHVLGQASYLVVNNDHPYTIEIDSREVVETFCVFFASGFVESAAELGQGTDRELLDAPGAPGRKWSFREVLQSRQGVGGAALAQLKNVVQSPQRAAAVDAEDALVSLATALALEHADLEQLHRRVEAVKAATRDEIFRRVCLARDVVESSLDESLGLSDLARLSHLSPFHLHRHFRRTFGETPQAYRTRRRLQRAAAALRSSSQSVTEIALDAGFSSLGSFSSLFKRRFDVSPLKYRLEKEQE